MLTVHSFCSSCQVLQGHDHIQLHLPPSYPYSVLCSERRLLRLPGRQRRTGDISVFSSLPLLSLDPI